jgi:hypothetical protein
MNELSNQIFMANFTSGEFEVDIQGFQKWYKMFEDYFGGENKLNCMMWCWIILKLANKHVYGIKGVAVELRYFYSFYSLETIWTQKIFFSLICICIFVSKFDLQKLITQVNI